MRAIVATVLLAAIAVTAVAVAGCGATLQIVTAEGSGNVITQEISVEGFDKVRIQSQFKARIIKGDEYKVTVRVDDNLVQDLDIQESGTRIVVVDKVVRNRTLDVRLRPERSYTLRNVTLEVDIVAPELAEIDASGATDVKVEGFSEREMVVRGSGAARVAGRVDADRLTVDASGASQVHLTGTADYLNLETSGASNADLSGLAADYVDVKTSGASRAHVNATERVDAVASGASHVKYEGAGNLGHSDASGVARISRH